MVTLATVLFVAAGVQADTLVNWSTGAAYVENLGNTCHTAFSIFPAESNRWNLTDTECDKVTLGTGSGSLDLTLGVPQTVVVNSLTFEVGWTGDMLEADTKSNVYYLTRDITINGITKPIVNPITHGVTWDADSLLVQTGDPVAFGNIIVTPLGWAPDTFFADNSGVYTQTSPSSHTISPVYAEFLLSEVSTAITLVSFEAKPGSNKVTLTWETATEIDNAGFNIVRAESENGAYIKINDAVIPAKAGTAGGASYQFIDSNAKNRTTYYYKLQDISLNGSTADHGPKSATPRWFFGIFGK